MAYEKHITKLTFYVERLKTFPLRLWTSKICQHLPFLFNIELEVVATATEINKRHPNQE